MTNKLILTPCGFKTWELVQAFKQGTSKGVITVPKGFKTDLATTPRFLWIMLPPFGRYSQAAVVHDYLYHSDFFNKIDADKMFYELMIKYGTWKWKAKIMYWAVFLFGGRRW